MGNTFSNLTIAWGTPEPRTPNLIIGNQITPGLDELWARCAGDNLIWGPGFEDNLIWGSGKIESPYTAEI